MAGGLVYNVTGGSAGPLGNALTVRKAVPESLPTRLVPVKGKPSTRAAWGHLKLDPKKGASTAPRRTMEGEPIHQLERSRNRALPNSELFHQPKPIEKRGDMEGTGDALPIVRESETNRHRRRQQLAGERRAHLAASGGKVVLGIGAGSGFDYYKGVRIKPALPSGRADVSAATTPTTSRVATYLESTMPVATTKALALASPPLAPTTSYAVAVEDDDVSPVAIARANVLPDTAPTKPAAGGFLFLIAATFVAWMVLK